MRLEVRNRRCDPAADADEAEETRARPARGPAVVGAGAERDDDLCGLGIASPVDVVAPVHGDEDAAGSRLAHETVRVAQAARDDAEIGSVGSHGQDRGAPAVALAAGIARRAAPEDEPTAVVEDVVLLVQPE